MFLFFTADRTNLHVMFNSIPVAVTPHIVIGSPVTYFMIVIYLPTSDGTQWNVWLDLGHLGSPYWVAVIQKPLWPRKRHRW